MQHKYISFFMKNNRLCNKSIKPVIFLSFDLNFLSRKVNRRPARLDHLQKYVFIKKVGGKLTERNVTFH
jgi:hypothetical protein